MSRHLEGLTWKNVLDQASLDDFSVDPEATAWTIRTIAQD